MVPSMIHSSNWICRHWHERGLWFFKLVLNYLWNSLLGIRNLVLNGGNYMSYDLVLIAQWDLLTVTN